VIKGVGRGGGKDGIRKKEGEGRTHPGFIQPTPNWIFLEISLPTEST
jgi:hypothetical protein